MTQEIALIEQNIMNKIFIIRDVKVMLDFDLAELYQTETKSLKRQVKRNIHRFPNDFMFELTIKELRSLRYQFGTSNARGGTRYPPMAFTEQGVAMLSSILNSEKAIDVNIQIIRIFTKMRTLLMDTTVLQLEIEKIKKKLANHDKNIELVFTYLDELIAKQENPQPRKPIGYKK